VNAVKYGIPFLDDALCGIFPGEVVLLGAPSGIGKTQLCCNIALSNMEDGKRVHFFALEANDHEIERRLKYPRVMERYYADPHRPPLGKIRFPEWLMGTSIDAMIEYENSAQDFMEKAYENLHVFYRDEKFGIDELTLQITMCADQTDLIIVDHIHFFDFDDQNEHRAIREITKTIRSLAKENRKPIILVAHLRKKDRGNMEICAGLDEFHGSSDLFKIVSSAITISPGKPTEDGKYETFMRTPKNRFDQGNTRYLARMYFDPKKGGYDREYEIGWADQKRDEEFIRVPTEFYPQWARPRNQNNEMRINGALPQRAPWYVERQ
jgi:KaiC/GvpD/RAD55 family RecA-like ATPase